MKLKYATAGLLACGALVAVSPGVAAAKPNKPSASYRSCAQLLQVYPNGVAKGPVAARNAVEAGYLRPAITSRAIQVYKSHEGRLDRDRDGVACEQSS